MPLATLLGLHSPLYKIRGLEQNSGAPSSSSPPGWWSWHLGPSWAQEEEQGRPSPCPTGLLLPRGARYSLQKKRQWGNLQCRETGSEETSQDLPGD